MIAGVVIIVLMLGFFLGWTAHLRYLGEQDELGEHARPMLRLVRDDDDHRGAA